MAIHNISKCIGVTTATCLRWGLLGRDPEAGLGRNVNANTDILGCFLKYTGSA